MQPVPATLLFVLLLVSGAYAQPNCNPMPVPEAAFRQFLQANHP